MENIYDTSIPLPKLFCDFWPNKWTSFEYFFNFACIRDILIQIGMLYLKQNKTSCICWKIRFNILDFESKIKFFLKFKTWPFDFIVFLLLLNSFATMELPDMINQLLGPKLNLARGISKLREEVSLVAVRAWCISIFARGAASAIWLRRIPDSEWRHYVEACVRLPRSTCMEIPRHISLVCEECSFEAPSKWLHLF